MMENGSTNGSDYLRVEGVVKNFGAISVLKGVDLHVSEGEVLGLIGDNGAGKSTLLKTITGFHRPDDGRILIEGEEVNLRSVSQARSLGIQTVYQDLALVNELSVFHNMFLNGEMTLGPFLNNRKMKEKTSQYLADMGVNIPSIDTEVARLSGGQRQAIAVARAVYSDAKMLLLDEPLAAMGAKEGALILDLIQRLKEERGIPMILIVHNYAQVFDVCDRVNLLRNGRIEYDRPVAETSVEELTEIVVSEYRKARETGNGGEGRLEPSPTRRKQVNSGYRDCRRSRSGQTRCLGKNGVHDHRAGLCAAPGRIFRLQGQRCDPGVFADDPPVHHTKCSGQLPRPPGMATDVGGYRGDRGDRGCVLAPRSGSRPCRRDAISGVR